MGKKAAGRRLPGCNVYSIYFFMGGLFGAALHEEPIISIKVKPL
jgi:hypothetical protein